MAATATHSSSARGPNTVTDCWLAKWAQIGPPGAAASGAPAATWARRRFKSVAAQPPGNSAPSTERWGHGPADCKRSFATQPSRREPSRHCARSRARPRRRSSSSNGPAYRTAMGCSDKGEEYHETQCDPNPTTRAEHHGDTGGWTLAERLDSEPVTNDPGCTPGGWRSSRATVLVRGGDGVLRWAALLETAVLAVMATVCCGGRRYSRRRYWL